MRVALISQLVLVKGTCMVLMSRILRQRFRDMEKAVLLSRHEMTI